MRTVMMTVMLVLLVLEIGANQKEVMMIASDCRCCGTGLCLPAGPQQGCTTRPASAAAAQRAQHGARDLWVTGVLGAGCRVISENPSSL